MSKVLSLISCQVICSLSTDLYGEELSENSKLRPVLSQVEMMGDSEIQFDKELANAKGMLETLFSIRESVSEAV
jgi:hypothetical protein